MRKFLPYILRGLGRSRVRTTLTVLGVMVAVGVFSLLASLESSMDRTIDQASRNTMLIVTQSDQW